MEVVFILSVFFLYMLVQGFISVIILVKVGERKSDDPLLEEIKNLTAEIAVLKEKIRLMSENKKTK